MHVIARSEKGLYGIYTNYIFAHNQDILGREACKIFFFFFEMGATNNPKDGRQHAEAVHQIIKGRLENASFKKKMCLIGEKVL